MNPGEQYRDDLRYAVRVFWEPKHDGLAEPNRVSWLRMDDLEALYELIMGHDPRRLAPAEYHSPRFTD